MSNEIALNLGTSKFGEMGEFLKRLDSLGYDPHLKTSSDCDD